jgi:hypothetical protein
MKGRIPLPAGKLEVAPRVWFDVRLTDTGTCLSLCDERVNRRYFMCFDEHGNIDRREVAPLSPQQSEPVADDTRPQVVAPSVVDEMMRGMRRARIRPLRRFKAFRMHAFIIRYQRAARPRNQCYPMAGYANATATYVMYRVPSSTRFEGLAKLVSADEMIIKDDYDQDRLPTDQWETFLHLPVGNQFKLNNQTWTKLGPKDVAPLVAGKIFYRRHVERP